MTKITSRSCLRWCSLFALFSTLSLAQTAYLTSYKGTPYDDSRYHGGAQKIPGRVQCAYYDRGGEGVAYHDSDSKNSCSVCTPRIRGACVCGRWACTL
jgi:hypothetical protein